MRRSEAVEPQSAVDHAQIACTEAHNMTAAFEFGQADKFAGQGGADEHLFAPPFDGAELANPARLVIGEVCRSAGISEATFYNWRKKYGGLTPSEMKRLKLLDEENGKLKKLVADLSLDRAMLQDVIKRKL
jgi:putative transposase